MVDLLGGLRRHSVGQITKPAVNVVDIAEATEQDVFKHAADLFQKYTDAEAEAAWLGAGRSVCHSVSN